MTGAERGVQGCSKSGPKFGPPGGPANLSTLLFPLCFQYTFLKGNNRRAARQSRFGPARRSRFGPAWRTQNETESCTRQSEISQPPTQEFWNLSSTIHPPPPRVIALLERRAAAPFHPARSPSFQPPIDDNGNPVSHSGKHKPRSTARSLWAASIRFQLSLSQDFQPRHPPAPPTARPHRRLARPHTAALRR